MPSGVIRKRMSAKYHPMPIKAWGTDDQGDLSGLRGPEYRDGTTLREYKDPPSAPQKYRPFNSSKPESSEPRYVNDEHGHYGITQSPKAAEIPVNGGKEGKQSISAKHKKGKNK